MKLYLPLITLLCVAPVCAMDSAVKERLKKMSEQDINAKVALANANLAQDRKEIEKEEDAFWSQSIDAMEEQVGIKKTTKK